MPNQGNSALCGNPPPASLCLRLPCRDKIANSVLQPTASTASIHNQLPILKPHHSPSPCLNNSRSHQTKYLAIFWPNRNASVVLVSRGCLAKVLGYLLQEEGGLYLSLSPARAPPELISAPCFAQEGKRELLSSRQHLLPSQFGFFARREEPRIINDSMMKQPHSSLLFISYKLGPFQLPRVIIYESVQLVLFVIADTRQSGS